jgi:hypothetical protein
MGKEHPFDRWGDIWSGIIAKKICDTEGWAVVINGSASIEHRRASDVNTNIKKEASGYAVNENLWTELAWGHTYGEVAGYACHHNLFYNEEYSKKLMEAVKIWSELTK